MENLKEQYQKEVMPALMKKFEYKSVMEVPKLEKIVINIGLGDIKDNPKSLDNAISDLTLITGQKPVITKAKKSLKHIRQIPYFLIYACGLPHNLHLLYSLVLNFCGFCCFTIIDFLAIILIFLLYLNSKRHS